MTAQVGVNVNDRSREIGEKILTSMVGKSVEEFTFKKADQAKSLGSRATVTIKGETVRVDPQLIFQRLITADERLANDPKSLFEYELCSHPPALFETPFLPLKANKASLADVLWKAMKEEQLQPSGDVRYVLDGGALLHRIPWPRGFTFDGVSELYVNYVTQKYGANAVIVFDGYTDEPTTKDPTHRRTGGHSSVTVHFTGAMVIQSKKENKQRFIQLLSNKLELVGCVTFHSTHDADVLIAQTAVASARIRDTVFIGDDTDILVLLLHHAEMDGHDVFFCS